MEAAEVVEGSSAEDGDVGGLGAGLDDVLGVEDGDAGGAGEREGEGGRRE